MQVEKRLMNRWRCKACRGDSLRDSATAEACRRLWISTSTRSLLLCQHAVMGAIEPQRNQRRKRKNLDTENPIQVPAEERGWISDFHIAGHEILGTSCYATDVAKAHSVAITFTIQAARMTGHMGGG